MTIKQNGMYQTSKGKTIDLNKLINQNELTIAVGNAKVNARGDKIGPGGQVIKKQEEYQTRLVPDQIRKQPEPEQSVVTESVKPKTTKSQDKGTAE